MNKIKSKIKFPLVRRGQEGGPMCIHVSKCKNNKIK
jgi:hypothetical protein